MMSGRNRKLKRRNRIYRRIAIALTVALLAGQSHAFVLAEENVGDVPSSGETGADVSGNGNVTDGGNGENANGTEQGGDNGGTTDQNPGDNENKGDQQDDGDGEVKCVCGMKCAEDAVNMDCLVCAADYAACTGKADDAGNNGSENDDPENKDPENGGQEIPEGSMEGTGAADGQDTCVCETACTEDVVNAECPVCAADYANCAPNAGGGVNPSVEAVLQEALDAEAGIAMLADESVEAYAVGEEITYGGIKYVVTGDGEVEVGEQGQDAVSGDIIIPASFEQDGVTYRVTSIGKRAFYGCFQLINIEIPEGVASIGEEAFTWCSSLSSVKIPEGVTSIGDSAFYHCNGLSSVEIPGSVTSIGDGAFLECRMLSSVEIPGSVTSIGVSAFRGCISLSSVEIPGSVTSIGNSAFDSCIRLSSVEIPGSVTSIGNSAFYHCNGLSSVEIQEGVTSIGQDAFRECRMLSSVKIPGSVTSIGVSAFRGCSSLSSVEIQEGVTSIGEDAFRDCSSLSSVEIQEGVTSIGQDAFASCSSLSSVEIPGSVTSMGYRAFLECTSLSSVEIQEGVTSIAVAAFARCSSLSSVKIPESVTGIGMSAFLECTSLSSVEIPESVTFIGYAAFSNCSKLSELRIVVLSDGHMAFPKVDNYKSYGAFEGLPKERYLLFVDRDGRELTGAAYENAKAAFIEAAKNDNNPDDNPDDGKWWGWSLKESSVVEDTYTVTINVKKDGSGWIDHGRTFALTKDGGTSFVTNLDAVEAGTYTIYDVTGLTADEFRTKGLNTDVSVTVTDADVSAEVDYYTVTFCDYDAATGETAYGDGTDQKPQTVLKTVGRVAEPAANPTKEGHAFARWVTAPGGDAEFAFASTEITAPTKIYAKWTKTAAPTHTVTVDVKKDDAPWPDSGRVFALTKDGTAFVTDLNAVEAGTYTVSDVTGLTADEFQAKGLNTGVSVTVTDAAVTATVDYYTATFYDGADSYVAGTPQQPQTVLKGQYAAKPDDPEKTGWQFAGWKTTDGGSTLYDFDTPVTGTIGIYASWVKETAEQLHITATATEGGDIAPKGDISVTKGGEQTFTITPDEGNRIKTVTVDGEDVTGELKDTLARAQAGARYYTFANVTENHTIRAEFESDGNTPGGGDNPNPGGGGDNPNPGGGGDNPNPGGGGDNQNPGGGSGTGDNTKPGGGSDTGGSGGGNSGDSGGNSGGGDSAGNGQAAAGSETTSLQAGSGAAGTSAGVNTVSDGSKAADGSASSATGQTAGTTGSAVSGSVSYASGQTADADGTAAGGREPGTGDTAHMEVYATIAMVAGLTYLLLYFMEESRGMTEREKDVFVAAFVRWGKKGGAFRKGCAVVAIFCLLAYYHAIGKHVGQNALNEKYLGQVL